MALKTKVIAKINNLTEARYFAAMGVDWLSFYLDPVFPDSIDPEQAKEIIEWVSGPKILGAFNSMPIEEVLRIAEELKLDGLAIGPSYEQIPDTDKEVLWYLNLEDPKEVDAGFIDLAYSHWDTLSEDKRSKLQAIASNRKLFLQIDVEPVNLLTMVESLGLEGIIVGGGNEERTGQQSFERMDDLLEALQVEA